MYLKQFFGEVTSPHPCVNCRGDETLDFNVRMAFQPIIDLAARNIYAYEALVRGENGEGAAEVIARVPLIFEVTESEQIRDVPHVVRIIKDYQGRGFLTAIDDFGAGYAGLNLLAEFQPDVVKLDMALIRGVDADRVRRSITSGIVATCRALGCEVLAEGVETLAEFRVLREMGITKFQGYLFARPALEALPQVGPALWATLDTP